MTDVIIAFSGADAALVASIAERASALGVDVRLAPQPPQDNSDAPDIAKQIDEAGVLLVCWSDAAVVSGAVKDFAAAASAQGKLAACRLAPCVIPFPFDAVPTIDLRDWAGRIASPQWAELIATIGQKLRRPALAELLRARLSDDPDALESFAGRFPDEPEARRIWAEREAKYRLECASILRDARQHLEHRVASEQSKIENALATFARDFDAWLEREKRGEQAQKPNLNTLFEIWLERGGRRTEPKAADGAPSAIDDGLKKNAEVAEKKSRELQRRLDAEAQKVEELERRLRAAELFGKAQPQPDEERRTTVAAPASITLEAIEAPKPRRRISRNVAALVLLVAGAGAAAQWLHLSGREPPQLRAAYERIGSAFASVEAKGRQAVAFIVEAVGGDLSPEATQAATPPQVAPRIAHPTPQEFLATADAQERRELVAALAQAEPSETLARLLDVRKDETIDALLRSERQSVAAKLNETAPPAEAVSPLAQLAQSPPRDIVKALEANVPPQTLAEVEKLLAAAAPPKLASYRVYDNRDIDSDDVAKLRNLDQQGCVAACRKKESCKAYTFDKWNHTCYLKSSLGDFKLNPRSWSGVREDVRIPRAPSGEITMERYPSKAFPGSGYKSLRSGGPEECEDRCRTEDACVAFTFRLDEGSCHLFKTTGEYFSNQLADSGGKRQE